MPATKRKSRGDYEVTRYINGVKKHFYGKTAEEAEEKMWREYIRFKDENDDYNPYSETFAEVRNRWYKNKSPKTAATKKMYEIDCFRKISVLDHKCMSAINETDIKGIMEPLTDKTNIAEKVYMCLNQIFEYAIKKRMIQNNPMGFIDRPKNKTKEKSKRTLTENEKKVIEMTEWNHRQELLLKLFLNYGFRKQEATALQKKNINIKDMTITIDHANDYTNNVPRKKGTKSDAGDRVVPILDVDKMYFTNLIRDLEDEDYLLQMVNGKCLTNNSYRQLWDSIRRRMRKTARNMKLEIPDDLTSRMCRHEYSIKIMGLKEREQMYLMGHEDISTTRRNYQTIGVEHIDRKELNKISKKKNGSPSSAKK